MNIEEINKNLDDAEKNISQARELIFSGGIFSEIQNEADLDKKINQAKQNPDSICGAVVTKPIPAKLKEFPLNLSLVFLENGGLDFQNQQTLGDFDSGVSTFFSPHQIFFNASALAGLFGGNANRIPEYWGAKGRKQNFSNSTGFDNSPAIQAAINSGKDTFPIYVHLQGLQYLVKSSLNLCDHSAYLKGQRDGRRTWITAMDNFDGPEQKDNIFDSFRAVVLFGSSTRTWAKSFYGGFCDLSIDGNSKNNPNIACSYVPGWIGENTTLRSFTLSSFDRYGFGFRGNAYTNGLTIENFMVIGFQGDAIGLSMGGGTSWSIRNGTINARRNEQNKGLGKYGILARTNERGGGCNIKNVHIESCYDGICVPNDLGTERGVIYIEGVDHRNGANSVVHIKGKKLPRHVGPTVLAQNLGLSMHTPKFLEDDVHGNYPKLSASNYDYDNWLGFKRTPEKFENLSPK